MIVQARIYEPHATALRKIASTTRRPVSTEVQIAVEKYIAAVNKPRKSK